MHNIIYNETNPHRTLVYVVNPQVAKGNHSVANEFTNDKQKQFNRYINANTSTSGPLLLLQLLGPTDEADFPSKPTPYKVV